ncbi:Precorrin-6A reductase [Burkholderia multivorans]|nr:Precorrin-6A reductase [Burkholderia multivorans]
MSARILLLGGTGDALTIARALGPQHVYSLAGLGKVPDDLRCAVRVGGFGGAAALAAYQRAERIGLVIDATHPYAARISANAAAAARDAGVPLWALRRAPWTPQPGDDWRMVDDWAGIEAAIAPFRRPLFTLGREPLAHLDAIPPHQFWLVRCLDPHPGNARTGRRRARAVHARRRTRAVRARGDRCRRQQEQRRQRDRSEARGRARAQAAGRDAAPTDTARCRSHVRVGRRAARCTRSRRARVRRGASPHPLTEFFR